MSPPLGSDATASFSETPTSGSPAPYANHTESEAISAEGMDVIEYVGGVISLEEADIRQQEYDQVQMRTLAPGLFGETDFAIHCKVNSSLKQ